MEVFSRVFVEGLDWPVPTWLGKGGMSKLDRRSGGEHDGDACREYNAVV